MTRAWDYMPGVPSAGHLTGSGFWHSGAAQSCSRCNPTPRHRPERSAASTDPQRDRRPYVGDGADGARRSAEIDRTEADQYPTGSARQRECLVSAEAWERQAERLDGRSGEAFPPRLADETGE